MKVTLERIECDVCSAAGERFTIAFPDGTKILDRCERHSKKILALKEEKGEWSPINAGRRNGIVVTTPQEIAARREKKK